MTTITKVSPVTKMNDRNEKGQFSSHIELEDRYQELLNTYAGFIKGREQSFQTLKSNARSYLHWCQNNELDPIHDVDEDDIRWWVQEMEEDLEETAITNRFYTARKFYYVLKTDQSHDFTVESNPTVDVRLDREFGIRNRTGFVRVLESEGREDIIAPGYDEVKKLFQSPKGNKEFSWVRNELICRMLWNTAMRADELSRVRTDKIDWDNREIEIRSAKLNREDHPELYRRKVWWDPELTYLMRRWETIRGGGDNTYFLIGERGGQLSPSYISRIVKETAEKVGIQEPLTTDPDGTVTQWMFTAHRLRHARISHLANETDMDLNHIRMMAGHASIQTTLRYVHEDWTAARKGFHNKSPQ